MRSDYIIYEYLDALIFMIYGLQYGQNGSKFRTILWSHALRPAQIHETYYALVPHGLSPAGPVQNPQTIMVSNN
jgi:hypothetical protein